MSEPAMMEFIEQPYKDQIRADATLHNGLADLSISMEGITAIFNDGSQLAYPEPGDE